MSILDGNLVRRRREELGLSLRALAAQLGVTGSVMRPLEAGENHPDLTVGFSAKLAEALAIDLATLVVPGMPDAPERPDSPPGDVAAVGALLHTTGVLTPAAALCEALGWDKAHLDRALGDLDHQARAVGLRLNRNPAGYSLVRSVEACDQAQVTAVLRCHIARDGLNLTEASMLARIQATGAPKEPSNPETVALGVLRNARLIEEGTPAGPDSQAPLVLAEAVRYSLLLDEELEDPPPTDLEPGR